MSLKDKENRNKFINEFQTVGNYGGYGRSFSAKYVLDALCSQRKFDTATNHQEDSEEFLGCLLNALHDKLKGDVADNHNDKESPITTIFQGRNRSIVCRPDEDDFDTPEPYKTLILNIQPDDVHTVERAIENMTITELISDANATKTVYLDELPTVLILHLNLFVSNNVGGTQKFSKNVCYGSKLVIKPGKTDSYSCYLQREREREREL
jgi:ubiquitin carboxyl-terminal hydrolase 10